MTFALFAASLLVAVDVWFLVISNTITLFQRLRAINACRNGDQLSALSSVSYLSHLWRVGTFRDPWSIYPDELANLMRVAA